jgi:hypothetical protein
MRYKWLGLVLCLLGSAVGSAQTPTTATRVQLPELFTLALAPTTITGGTTVVATITVPQPSRLTPSVTSSALNTQAASLSSSHPDVAKVARTVPINTRGGNIPFNITTSGVAAATSVTITVAYSGQTKTATFTILPAALTSVTLNSAAGTSGNQLNGTVALNGPAPASGVTVGLALSKPIATVPATVIIPGGAASASFTANLAHISSPTAGLIVADHGGVSKTAQLTVNPVTLKQFDFPTYGQPYGGNLLKFGVTLTGPAPPGGASVILSSTHPTLVPVPAVVPIAEGATWAGFTSQTKGVATNTAVVLAAAYAGGSQAKSFSLLPPDLATGHMAFGKCAASPNVCQDTVVGGVTLPGHVRVYVAVAPAGGTRVGLSTDQPTAVSLPAEITIPENGNSASFTLNTMRVRQSTTARITATILEGGLTGSSRYGLLQVLQPGIQSITASGYSFTTQSGTIPLTITLTAPGFAGDSITISQDPPSAPVALPTKIPVPASGVTTTYNVVIKPITNYSGGFYIYASYGGTSKYVSVEVR